MALRAGRRSPSGDDGRRDAVEGWVFRVEAEMDMAVVVPELGVSLALREVYDGATLTTVARPRLVWPDPPER